MNDIYTQKQYQALMKNNNQRNLFTEIHLFNQAGIKLDILKGVVTGGNINISADSNYKRTANIDFILDSKLVPKLSGRLWLDKTIKIRLGVEYNSEIIWYNMGHYGVSNVNMGRGIKSGHISIEALDLMCYLDGTLGGEITHTLKLDAKKGMKINDVIAQTVRQISEVSIERFEVNGKDATLPFDMEFNRGTTIYEAIKELVDLYKSQEFFFDVNGVFNVRRIRDKKSDMVLWDFTKKEMDLIIDIDKPLDFSNVRNAIHLWGAFNQSTGEQYYWKFTNRCARDNKKDLDKIENREQGDICHIRGNNKSYVWDGFTWNELSFTVIEQFNVENIGLRNKVVSDDKIMSKDQLPVRAEYELYKTSNFAESINLTTVPIYLLEDNMKISVGDNELDILGDFLIKDISFGLNISDTMTINAEKIYY